MNSDYLLGIFKLFLSIIAYMFECHDTVEIVQKLALITNHSIMHVCFIFTDAKDMDTGNMNKLQRKPKGQSRIDNPDTGNMNKRWRKPKGQSRMDNPETQAT